MLIFLLMAMVAAYVNRNLVFDQRSSANQYRSTLAFEAAEAGLQWAEAQVNSNQRIGSDCLAVAGNTATSFRERYLGFDGTTGKLVPRTWNAGGAAQSPMAACVASTAGWSCTCPTQQTPALGTPAGDGPFPSFSLQWLPGGKPGVVRLAAVGCSSLAAPCQQGGTRADATARIEVTLGLLGAIRTPPAAAITAAGRVDADAAAFEVDNPDPATGIAIHAGLDIAASQVKASGAHGPSHADVLVANDSSLASLSADRLFASTFGLDKAHWKSQPAVTQVICSSNCAGAVTQAIADRATGAMVWISGDAVIEGPASLGTPERPVVLVVDGSLQLSGDVAIQGAVYAGAVTWNGTAGGAVHGALIIERDYRGSGTPGIAYDADVLKRLGGFSGSFARVPGSWRDF